MEEKTAAPDLSNFVEKREESGDAVIPGVSEGAPAGRARREGEGDPSAREGVRPPLAQDDGNARDGANPRETDGRPSSRAVGREEGDGSPCAGEPDDAPAFSGPAYDAAAAGFAARSARIADEAEALYASWAAEAKELAKEYPGFDLAAVAKEPAFARLLRAGAGLRAAYEATHMDSVRAAIRAAAAAEAEARTLDGVRLRGLRPDENGARSGSAVLTGGMAGLSREQRARIAERAMRGLL